MARRSNNIEVAIVGEADFKQARREASRAFDRIESDGRDAAGDIERAFDRIELAPDGVNQFGDELAAAGEAGAEGITDALSGIDFDNIGAMGLDQLTGALTAAGPWVAAAGAIAVVFGDELIAGFDRGFNKRRTAIMRSITTGASESELAAAGQAAGEAYTAGFGESMKEVTATADELVRILGDIVPEADLAEATKQAQLLSDVLGVDVAEAARLAGRLVKQELVDNWEGAFDTMVGVTQEFGETGLEALNVLEEFGAAFQTFGIDAQNAAALASQAYNDGLTPTIERSAEAFEELQTAVRDADADAVEVIDRLVGDFDRIQEAFAKGGPAANAAAKEVIGALLAMESQAERNAAVNVLFAGSLELLEDPAEFLELSFKALNGELADFEGRSEDAADALESQVTAWQRLQREAEPVAAFFGAFAANELADVFEGVNDVADAAGWLVDKLNPWNDAAREVSDGSDEMAESIRFAAIEANAMADEAENMAGGLDDAADSVSDLRREFERLMGFQADELMRDIEAAIDDATDAIKETDASLVGMNGEIDITTEAGRKLERKAQDLSVALATAWLEMDNAGASAVELAGAQARAEAQLRAAGEAAGWEAEKVQGLIDRFLTLIGIGDVNTAVNITLGPGSVAALNAMASFLRMAPSMSGSRVVANALVTAGRLGSRGRTPSRSRQPSSSYLRQIGARAEGGPATGLTVVGEEGPELVDFGSSRAFVHNNPDSRRMISSAASMLARGGSATGTRQTPFVIQIDSRGSKLDDLLVEVLRKSISNRGGGTVAVLG